MSAVYLLDTNVVSELRRTKPHGAVTAWLTSVPVAQLFVSAVSLAEIQAGIELTRENDILKANEIEAWLDNVSGLFTVLLMDADAFRLWARLMHRRSDALYEDAMIAAVALTRNLTVATRNVRDFSGFGVKIVNPFHA